MLSSAHVDVKAGRMTLEKPPDDELLAFLGVGTLEKARWADQVLDVHDRAIRGIRQPSLGKPADEAEGAAHQDRRPGVSSAVTGTPAVDFTSLARRPGSSARTKRTNCGDTRMPTSGAQASIPAVCQKGLSA